MLIYLTNILEQILEKYRFLKPSNKLEIIVDNKSYFCTIYYVDNEKLTVFFETQTELPEKEIEVNIYSEDGVYNATSRIISSNYLNETTFYMLSFPSNIKHSQRREYLRADIETDFSLSVFLDGTEVEKIVSKTKNICAKGLAFIADRQMSAYSSLNVDLFLEGKIISTNAELVYSIPLRVNNTFKFLTAVTFTTISKEEMNFITLQCMKNKN
jgi:c-di-GMP-binding flagellar brake protein YcgR